MNHVDINAEGAALPDWAEAAATFTTAVCDTLQCENWDTSVLFCDNNFIQELNHRFRNKDEPTDILSFPLGETISENGEKHYASGDIIISLETLYSNCKTFDTSEDEEVRRLLIHGVLHLKGYDHATNEPEEEMLSLQEKILAKIKLNIINR
jgi:probable rRNA maturation factor